MKFSAVLALALVTYSSVASAAPASGSCFTAKNADDAEALQTKFKTFTANTPCKVNDQACVGDAFATCASDGKSTKFQLQPCSSTLKCVVLPLVLKSGTSITCATDAIQQQRLKDARACSASGAQTRRTEKSIKARAKGSGGDIAAIRKQNAADAQTLQKKFAKFTAKTPCTPNETACVGSDFAKCDQSGKFSIQPCAAGLKCFVLPLVLKKGTSITCDTQADRDARIQQAINNQ